MSTRGRGSARGGRGGRAQVEIGADGKEINPYIPRYISNAPWYVGKSDDYLEHQRSQTADVQAEWYDRGKSSGQKPRPTKFRKGACKNCGSMTHKEQDCLERPRKIKAKYSGTDMAMDEEVKDITTTWDSKRDRWNGYEADDYMNVVNRFEKEEQEKQELERVQKEKEEQEQKEIETKDNAKKSQDDYGLDSLLDESGSEDDGEDKKETTRTLRAREDKARYLQDLSEDGAVFNPKSRTLRTEEDGVINERGQFIRNLTGKAAEHDRYRQLAEEAGERGETIHLEKGPTASLIKFKQMESEKKTRMEQVKKSLLDKYGGGEYLEQKRPQEVEEVPKEEYEEYDENGNIIKKVEEEEEEEKGEENEGVKKEQFIRSKYEEDVFPGNHTSVWGSYWKNHKWGYECCHSLIEQSYCTGEAGKQINDRSKKDMFTGMQDKKRKLDQVEEE